MVDSNTCDLKISFENCLFWICLFVIIIIIIIIIMEYKFKESVKLGIFGLSFAEVGEKQIENNKNKKEFAKVNICVLLEM